MRKKKLILNTISSLTYEVVALICGLILPRIILLNFGSDINGLVHSITQFLSVVALLDMGIGGVVQAALYKPLANNNNKKINEILSSAQNFFTKIAIILLIYAIILAFVYPCYIDEFGYWPTVVLIFAIAINSLSQYYFGIVNKLLLQADQKNYIPTLLQSIACILNTVSCIILIKSGASIQIVKLNTSIVYLIQPIGMSIYIRRKYNINKRTPYTGEPIPQKWNGISQHIASYVMGNTDTIILTLLSTLKYVSIYNTYYLVVYNIRVLVLSITNGVESLLGDMIARNEREQLNNAFSQYEISMHLVITIVFTCTAILIKPFISIYTRGITDTDYLIPYFGYLLTFANMMYCYRVPYNTLIMSAGHFKQTQTSAWIEMTLNIVISIILVVKYGIIGVTIGTLIAMLYRTIYFAWYISNNILNRSMHIFFKHMIINCIVITLSLIVTKNVSMNDISYLSWFIMTIKILLMVAAIGLVINYIAYRDKIFMIFKTMLRRRKI